MTVDELVTVARVEDVPPGKARMVTTGDVELAVYHIDGRFYVTQAHCLHLGGPLGDGVLDGHVITCPWHGWQYDVRTGENEFDRAIVLETFEAVVEDGDVKVAF
ncbi:MAG TPA: Rieske 2Fe-2S domain-containing protein [Gaiellaceae bacterium]|jgi:nitrite reductase/ring-hydroxylating ferredoxin subunit|nr:Rieske 2Fe-2S domain-containing protein [Gaiellaceae bacterium]